MKEIARILIQICGIDRYNEGKRISRKERLKIFIVEEPELEIMGEYTNRRGEYYFYISSDGFFCSCPDNIIRNSILCKHLIAGILRAIYEGYSKKVYLLLKKLILSGRLWREK